MLWNWDSRDFPKIISKIDLIGKEGIPKQLESTSFMMTLQSTSLELYATVTGPGLFHFIRVNQETNALEMLHS